MILGTCWAVRCAIAAARWSGLAAPLGLVAAATVVFHANFLAFAALAIALPSALLALEVDLAGWKRLVLAGALVALASAPWVFLFDLVGKTDTQRLSTVAQNLMSYSVLTARYSFPVAALAAFALLVAAAPKRLRRFSGSESRAFVFLAVFAVVYLAVVSLGPWCFYR